jgi:hypothetical protein
MVNRQQVKNMLRKRFNILVLFYFMSTVTGAVQARDKWILETGAQYSPVADVQVQPGSVSLTETFSRVGYETQMHGRLPFSVSFSASHVDIYQEEEVSQVRLPSHLEAQEIDLTGTMYMPFVDREDVYLRIGLTPAFYTDGEFDSGAFRVSSKIFGIYRPDNRWTWVAGLVARPDFDPVVVPVIGFIFRPDDRWEVNFASLSPGISYRLSDRVTVFSEFRVVSAEYEVENQGGRILRYRGWNAGGGVRYSVADSLRAQVSLGGCFNRRFKYADGDGKVVLDDGLYADIRLTADF